MGYGAGGEVLAEKEIRTAGPPLKIGLEADRTSILSDGQVKFTSNEQNRIADRFGFQSPLVLSPPQTVLGIKYLVVSNRLALHLVGRRCQSLGHRPVRAIR